ncbi:hypothetical protein C9374_004724 [Naegleria lovaniensis]|uniref:Protein kinase domain-containing protein n=1 Tax=Naegleria lovaniensis TaxID=51637 RepID=A0AA88KJM4_NAELO|nr:uncharacterized protein C9374_004724 [Naegleria lovaniensis]KAG2383387.1 hypothetical protein C9374_004724 [Naegleria lovaniensis]
MFLSTKPLFDSIRSPHQATPPEVKWIAKTFHVNHYEVENLGKGGFGTVYGIQRKEREACTFDHPHLLKIHDWEMVDGRLYIMSDLMQGSIVSLVLSEYECWRILYQMSQALLYLHELSFIHRDVKPTNILYAKKGKSIHYVLADFGLTRSEETMGERTDMLKMVQVDS